MNLSNAWNEMHQYIMGSIKIKALLLDPYNSIGKGIWDLMPPKDKGLELDELGVNSSCCTA